jgi:hypothetical protein
MLSSLAESEETGDAGEGEPQFRLRGYSILYFCQRFFV